MQLSLFVSLARRALPILLTVLALGMTSVFATEQKLQAKLIWGTDDAKPSVANLKEVDAKLKDKFCGIFKWKNYFEVGQEHFSLAPDEVKKVKMSAKCEIEVRKEANGMFEVRLYGEGKCIKKVRQAIPPGELLVIAGDDKNATAWFVVLNIE